jgi:hypothetical protein
VQMLWCAACCGAVFCLWLLHSDPGVQMQVGPLVACQWGTPLQLHLAHLPGAWLLLSDHQSTWGSMVVMLCCMRWVMWVQALQPQRLRCFHQPPALLLSASRLCFSLVLCVPRLRMV